MRIISTKEEREQLIESLVNEETNLFPLDKKDCELLKIIDKADLSAIKGFHHLCVIIRSSLTYEITMNEMSDICKVLEKICNDETSILWTSSHDNRLTCNLELVMIASK